MIYFDNNATTPVAPRVLDAMVDCWRLGAANASSQHAAGRRARATWDACRDEILIHLGAAASGARADQLILTSGGTEANNMALRGLVGRPPGHVLVSNIEHPSVLRPGEALRAEGFDVEWIPVDASGTVRWDRVQERLTSETRLVSVVLGNHETGVLQPVAEIARCCRAAGVPVHTDAVQAVGKIPVNFSELGVTALSFAAHKFHGPCGIGGLVLRSGIHLTPLLRGGVQQSELRPGTEPVALLVGMCEALRWWTEESALRPARLARLRDRFEIRLSAMDAEVAIVGQQACRLPHTTCAAFPGFDRQALVIALDLAGVACSSGSACASGASEPSPVLTAMGLPERLVGGAIRFSMSALTTEADIDQAAERILHVVNHLRRTSSGSAKPRPSRQQATKSL